MPITGSTTPITFGDFRRIVHVNSLPETHESVKSAAGHYLQSSQFGCCILKNFLNHMRQQQIQY